MRRYAVLFFCGIFSLLIVNRLDAVDDSSEADSNSSLKLNLVFAGKYEMANPQVSPNGLYIAYTKPNYIGITVYDVRKKKSISVTKASGAGYYFNWASDSFRLVYRTITLTNSSEVQGNTKAVRAFRGTKKKYAIEVFDLKNSFKTKVFESIDYVGVPVWSRDGQHLFFATSEDGNNQFKSYRFAYDNQYKSQGTNGDNLKFFYPTSNGLYKVTEGGQKVVKINPLHKKIEKVLESPNEQRILFETEGNEIYVSNIEGKHVKLVDKGTHATWSFDSLQIAYTSTNNPVNSAYADINIYEVKTEKIKPITQTAHALEAFPRFSRDNKRLFYTMRNDNGFYEISLNSDE